MEQEIPRHVFDFLYDVVPTPELQELFQLFQNPETTLAQLASAIRQRPKDARFLNQFYVAYQKKIKFGAEEISDEEAESRDFTDKAVKLFKQSPTRNVLFSSHLPRNPKETSADIDPRDFISKALQAEDFCHEFQLSSPEKAFLAGYHYDYLKAWIKVEKSRAAGGVDSALNEAWDKAFSAAKVCSELRHFLKIGYLQDLSVSAALLANLGKVLMLIFFPKGKEPSFIGYINQCKKMKRWEPLAYRRLMLKTFPLSDLEVCSLYVGFFTFLRQIEACTRFFLEPTMLKASNPQNYRLAALINIAYSLSEVAGVPETLPLTARQRSWLKDIGLKESHIMSALKAIDATR